MMMRLIDLLPALDDEAIERLREALLGTVEPQSRAALCLNLESELRSPKHVRDAVYNLQPPAFRILELLLDSPSRSLPLSGLRERVTTDTAALAARVSEGIVAGRNEGLHLYRRVLVEAWRSDLELDASEMGLLLVLRRELNIRQVEHFLVVHHRDFDQFWNAEHAFLDAMNGLRSRGLVYPIQGQLYLPEDLVALVRQVLGLEMGTDARQRLLSLLSGQALADSLSNADLKTTGSKDEKLQRLLDNYVQSSEVLGVLGVVELRELCRDLSLPTSGAKDEMIARILKHYATDKDLAAPEPEAVPPEPEARALPSAAFDMLFSSLRQQDLTDILSGIGSTRVTGTKEHLVKLVRESRFSETTLLAKLDMNQLEGALERQRLRLSGAKRDRIQRLLDWFASNDAVTPQRPGGIGD